MNRIESCNFEAGAAQVVEVIHPLQQCLSDNGEKIAAAVTEAQFREVLAVNTELRGEAEKLKADCRNYLHEVEQLKARIVWLECEAKAHDVASVPEGYPSYAEIYVGAGKFAICDWIDWPAVKSFNWRLTTRNSSGCLYAQAWDSEDKEPRSRVAMHRLIMRPTDGLCVDHINGDGLDNRRANLRAVTHQQNAFNQKGHGGSSKFKGVSLDKESGLWRAYITIGGRRKYLGRHGSEVDAAKAYNMAAKELYGEHARLNNDY